MIFWRNILCAFVSSGGLRLAGPNEDGFPSIRRLEQTQLEDFHPFEGWFSLESCIDSNFILKLNEGEPGRITVDDEIPLVEDLFNRITP